MASRSNIVGVIMENGDVLDVSERNKSKLAHRLNQVY